MRKRSIPKVCLLLAVTMSAPNLALAQESFPISTAAAKYRPASDVTSVSSESTYRAQNGNGDPLWNGMLIGAGIGAAVGMLAAPYFFCGGHDSECAAIVRVALGLPSIAGGLGVGALVDGLNSSSQMPPRTGGRIAGITLSATF